MLSWLFVAAKWLAESLVAYAIWKGIEILANQLLAIGWRTRSPRAVLKRAFKKAGTVWIFGGDLRHLTAALEKDDVAGILNNRLDRGLTVRVLYKDDGSVGIQERLDTLASRRALRLGTHLKPCSTQLEALLANHGYVAIFRRGDFGAANAIPYKNDLELHAALLNYFGTLWEAVHVPALSPAAPGGALPPASGSTP